MAILRGAEPFAHDGSDTGVLLCHGFTGTPQGLRDWGQYLADLGYTVRIPRLPGHGTTWQEMNRTRWQDWYAAVDTAFRALHAQCDARRRRRAVDGRRARAPAGRRTTAPGSRVWSSSTRRSSSRTGAWWRCR